MGSLILTVDAGKQQGWTLARGGLIQSCGLVQVNDKAALIMPTVMGGRVFVEYPIHYPEGRNRKGGHFIDPNDLIKLGSRAGRVQEKYLQLDNEVTMVFPYEWKGQVPKHISHNRIRGKLSTQEALWVWEGIKGLSEDKAENVWDSVGICLWVLEKEGMR